MSTQFKCQKQFFVSLFDFISYQRLQIAQCQILFRLIYLIHVVCEYFSYNIFEQIQYKLNFVYTQLNVKTVIFQIIQFSVYTVSASKTAPFQTFQFSISRQFKSQNSSISTNSVQHKYAVLCYLTQRQDPIRCYHSRPEWTSER